MPFPDHFDVVTTRSGVGRLVPVEARLIAEEPRLPFASQKSTIVATQDTMEADMALEPIADRFDGQVTASHYFVSPGLFTALLSARMPDATLGSLQVDVRRSGSGEWNVVQTPLSGLPPGAWFRWDFVFSGNPVYARKFVGAGNAYRIFLRGNNGHLYMVWSNGSSHFGPEWVSSSSVFNSEISAVEDSRGLLHAFVRGPDVDENRGQLWHYFQQGGFQRLQDMTLEPLGGDLVSNPVAVALDGGVLHVYLRGLDNLLWRRIFNGTTWNDWQALRGLGPTIGDPSVVKGTDVQGNRYVCVLYRDPSARIRSYIILGTGTSLSGTPSGGSDLLGTGFGRPAGTSMNRDVISLFARGPAGDLQFTNATLAPTGGGVFAPWISLGGSLADDPTAVGGGSSLHAFVQGRDDRLWHIWNDGVRWR